jgi:hypothetical protein
MRRSCRRRGYRSPRQRVSYQPSAAITAGPNQGGKTRALIGVAALFLAAAVGGSSAAAAQQVADTSYRPIVPRPEFAGSGAPVVLVDRGHHNLHAQDDLFEQFANILRQDGYRVEGIHAQFTPEVLRQGDVLVIVNALAARDTSNWRLPTSPAFADSEVQAIRDWVQGGGSLLLVADHMPFPGAVEMLARELGVEFLNGFAIVEAEWDPLVFRRADRSLRDHPITSGRDSTDYVGTAVTFVSGSAFRALSDTAHPLLVLGRDVVSIQMERAWHFDDSTPRIPVEGWLQGAALELGEGRAAIFGEAGMFAAQRVGPRRARVGMNSPRAPDNLQLLLNTIRWLARAPGY